MFLYGQDVKVGTSLGICCKNRSFYISLCQNMIEESPNSKPKNIPPIARRWLENPKYTYLYSKTKLAKKCL